MRMPSYPRIATGAAAICFFSLAVSAAGNKQNDPDQIGNRKVECTPNMYSIEKEIALGKGYAQQIERQAKIIDEPLKAKLYRIDPGVKIFRCKVQTPPGKQFEIRAEAYRRIEAALKENGIAFADNTPRVTLYQGPAGEPAAAEPVAPYQRAAAK